MPESHRLSYVGDPQFVESFLDILTRHSIHVDSATVPDLEPGMSYNASDPYSIEASGSYDTAEAEIANAIAEFAVQCPGRAHIHDGGAMPSGEVLVFRGRHELIDDLRDLLVLEQVEVDDPDEDDHWVSVEEQVEADPAGDGAIELRVSGWGDLGRPVAAAVAALHQRHPGQAQIDFGNRDPQQNSPNAT